MSLTENGSNWLVYGNQQWVELSFKARISKTYSYNAISGEYDVNYASGLQLAVRDEDNYAYLQQDIRYALLRGPGLPDTGPDGNQYLTQTHRYPDNEFNNDFVYLSTDAQASAIPVNPEYEVMLYKTDDFTGTTPSQSYKRNISGKPFLPSALTASLFAVITQPSSHDLSSLNLGGDVAISWTNPVGCKVDYVGIGWCDGSTCLEQHKDITLGDESVTFDTSSNTISSPSYGFIGTNCKDLAGIKRESDWFMQ